MTEKRPAFIPFTVSGKMLKLFRPRPNKWAQFSEENLRLIARRRHPGAHEDAVRTGSREFLIAMIETQKQPEEEA